MWNIINLVSILLMWWGLYMINKKMWNKYPWLSFIPLVNLYSLIQASWKSIKWLIYMIVWLIITLLSVFWSLISIMIWSKILITVFGFLTWLSGLLIIAYLLMYLHILDQISRRTWWWFFRALWFLILPWLIFPIIWYKFDWKIVNINKKKKSEEKEIISKKEEKVEL